MPSNTTGTSDIDLAQFHEISVAVGDSMPPVLEVLQRVDPSFREIGHQSDSRATISLVNRTGFKIEFLTPNQGSDDHQDKPVRMPALGGMSAQPLRYLDFLIKDPMRNILLHKGGIPILVPAPERFAIHKLIVAASRRSDAGASFEKSKKDVRQAGSLIEAMVHNGLKEDLGLAWKEAWDRGPSWRDRLNSGLEKLDEHQKSILKNAIDVACKVDDPDLSGTTTMSSESSPEIDK